MKKILTAGAVILSLLIGGAAFSPNKNQPSKPQVLPASTIAPTTAVIKSPSPTEVPSPTKKIIWPTNTPYPTVYIPPPQPPPPPQSSGWTCDCSKTCPYLSCAEAQYQLNSCGCSVRDGDNDGIACDNQCQ